jgi:hypothetical protein
MAPPLFTIRRAAPSDASRIAAVLEAIARERIPSAIESLSPREAFHVAVDQTLRIVGFQSLALWAPALSSMAHVGQIGTFPRAECRGQRVGQQLWIATEPFARTPGFQKLPHNAFTAASAFAIADDSPAR